MRTDEPIKLLRRTPVDDGEYDQTNASGASGHTSGNVRRPGRAASFPSTSPRARSAQRRKSRNATHATTPRDNAANSASA